MLSIKKLDSGYGKKQVLYSVSVSVHSGEIVGLIGPNGAGKSTVLKVVHGLIPVWNGEVVFQGNALASADPAERVSMGITFAPQGNRVFAELTVRENVELGGLGLPSRDLRNRFEEIMTFFPVLRARQLEVAGRLSGGEQQMVALGRALMLRPKLLMLDEPSLGLSPNLVSQVLDKIVESNRQTGTAILMVEQKVREVLRICHRVYSLKLGKVAFVGDPGVLLNNRDKLRSLFL